MAQGEKRNVSGFDVGTGHGSFFIRVNNQNYHNMFPDEVQIRTSSGFCSINPENPRAMQNLFGDEVLAMRFDSYEAGKSFYHKYASAVGFTVREDDMGKYKLGGEVVMKRWICNGEGFQQNIGDPSSSTRVKCPAAFCIHADSVSHKWLVIEFVAKHTHDLAPTCKHLQVAVADNLERKDAEYYIVGTAVKLPTSCERISITDVESALDYLCYKKDGDSGQPLCTWHLENEAHSIVNKRSFVSDFKVCMMEVLSQEDFELKWKAMVEKYKLSENPWIHRMYKKRHMWAETYLRGHFWGGLQSTRVCERINEHLSRFSHNKMRIFQFIQLCDEAIFPIRFSEAKAEYESIHIKFVVSTSLVKIEKHAADVFTRESYESERDGGSVSRIARSKGNQKCGRKKTNGDKRRKTNGDGHSRNV
ncbi:FAR1 DNA-binding domain [Sesbania bispinosa]|nr:FAR1 DNA-binding domain [Sesbania bispinosa]